MAYIIYYHKDQEVGRAPLQGPVLVGRSPECSVSIRDVLMSRAHCQIEQDGEAWVISDLASKNGTRVYGQPITRHVLRDGDVVKMGKSSVKFLDGAFIPNASPKPPTTQRPADPFEALSGTVSAFEYKPRGPVRNTDKLPTPKPGPQEPASYEGEKVRDLVNDLVSSSWDSIYEEARRSEAEAPQSPILEAVRRTRSRPPHVDLSLQVSPEQLEAHRDQKLSPENGDGPHPGVLETPRKRGRIRALFRRLAMLFQMIALLMLVRHTG